MTAPYRTPEASLRAEVERLTRELAAMRERRATGARYTRTALMIAWIRERIAAESAKGGAP